jgi:histidyl-tRNA synthetase
MKTNENINYSLPSGFDIEFLPNEKRLEIYFIDTIRQVFERYGFTPVETPAVERLEVLQAKGNQGDNIIYAIDPILDEDTDANNNEKSSGDRALKFDQTVPLAAYIARHLNNLNFPFARYQMDMVFRGERAKKGRYRQFRQCDIDVVSRDSLSLLYDAQMPAIIAEIFSRLNIGQFLIRISNRKVLIGMFRSLGIAPEEIKSYIKIIDTLDKIGGAKLKKALQEKGLSETETDRIIEFIQLKGTPEQVLEKLKQQELVGENAIDYLKGIEELEEVIQGIKYLGVSDNYYCIDLSIARGLDYYTGTVYETTLIGYESLGSICSGGRYENLVGIFVGEKMPGVGISIGLTRLIRNLIDEEIVAPLAATPAEVIILNMQSDLMNIYLKIAQDLRNAGINVISEFANRAVGKQLNRANKLGVPICILIGSNEYQSGNCRLKNLVTGEQIDLPLDKLIDGVREQLNRLNSPHEKLPHS